MSEGTSRARRVRLALVAAALAALLVAGLAYAKLGKLTPKDCVEDTGKANCDKDADGLSGARGIDLSADGTSLYVAGQSDDAVVRLKRDPGP